MKVKDAISEKQMEAILAVQKLNNELHDKYGWDSGSLPIISITLASYMMFISVSLGGGQEINLYNSEDEDRIYINTHKKTQCFQTWDELIK